MIDHRQVSRAIGAALTVAGVLLGAASTARAQSTPQIATVPRASAPTAPSEMWALCTPNPNTGAPADTCPVIQYGGFTTWAFTYKDNRVAYGLVSYDAQGTIVKTAQLDGARYIYKMTSDPTAKTISLWGQSNARVDVAWADLPQPPAPTGPVYAWVAGSSQPANAVLAPNAVRKAVCRGKDVYNKGVRVGWWDDTATACINDYGGNRVLVTQAVEFLTVVSGTAQWLPGESVRFVGPIPANAINAGKNFANYDQFVCAYGGYIGWVWDNICAENGERTGDLGPWVLVGTVQ